MNDVSMIVVSHDYGAEMVGSAESAPFLACELRQVFYRKRIDSILYPVLHNLENKRPISDKLTNGIWNKEQNETLISLVQQHTSEILLQSSRRCLLGGDHTSSIGAIIACNNYCIDRNLTLGVLWIDSHPDMNTVATSPSSRLHGMAVAATLGLVNLNCSLSPVLRPDQFLQIGINSTDSGEAINVSNSKIYQISANDISQSGGRVQEAIKTWSEQFDHIYLSLDFDVLSPKLFPGVNAPCDNAISLGSLFTILRGVPWRKMIMWDMVEYNLKFDIEGKSVEVSREILEWIIEEVFPNRMIGENLLSLP